MRILLVVLTLLSITVGAWAFSGPITPELVAEVENSFRFNGKAIHPGLVQQFESWMSDPGQPITVSFDVAAAADSNQYSGEGVVEDKSHIVEFTQNYKRYAYQYQGKLKNGLIVVRTWASSTRGTGVFQTLFFLRLSQATGYLADGRPYPRLLLTCERAYPLGDRTGVDIKLKGNEVALKLRAYPSGKVSDVTLKAGN